MKAKQIEPNTPKLSESIKNYLIIPFMESCNCSQHSIDGVVEIFEKAIAQELSNLKAQVRKEIEELRHTSIKSDTSFHDFCYSEALTDCLSIPSLKGEE